MRRRVRTSLGTWTAELLAVAWPFLALAIALAVSMARADDRIGDQLALARVCASEGGLEATAEECAAIAAVLRSRRCAGCSLERAARLYSDRVFDLERHDRRAWVAFLRADGRQPRRWPGAIEVRSDDGSTAMVQHARWASFRDRWLALYELAGDVVRGELVHACAEVPRHWGGRLDRARAERMGLVRIDCGETRNDFYALPTVEQRAPDATSAARE